MTHGASEPEVWQIYDSHGEPAWIATRRDDMERAFRFGASKAVRLGPIIESEPVAFKCGICGGGDVMCANKCPDEPKGTREEGTELMARAMSERNLQLREALEWYAEPVLTYAITQDAEPRSAVHADGGRRARAVLASQPAVTELGESDE